MRTRNWVLLVIGLAVLGGSWWASSAITLSALEEPGRFETWAATRAKRWLVGREARDLRLTLPSDEGALAIGGMRFRGQCAPCHGTDGRSPTDIGRGMYPRAVDLGSPVVQTLSDAELFVVIKYGIRLTGMPGFGRVLDDEEVAALTAYVRSLGAPPEPHE